jgi:hypothetical protein
MSANNSTTKSRNTSRPFEKNDNSIKKVGRTLFISSSNGLLSDKELTSINGLSSHHATKNGSYFLTFNNVEDATLQFDKLTASNYNVKVAKYQVFFTIEGLDDTSDYGAVKQSLINHVESNTGGGVLYFKLYRQKNKYLGCGDFTLDTKESMDKLLSKDNDLKNYTLDSLTGTFYRYNKLQGKNNLSQE